MNTPTPGRLIIWSAIQAEAYNGGHPDAHIPPLDGWVEIGHDGRLLDMTLTLEGAKCPGLHAFITYLANMEG